MKTVAYTSTAYRPDCIPEQSPSTERSWLKKLGRIRLPWGNTQELAPAKFFHQDTPADLRFGEEVKREDSEKKANGTYKPRITETEEFHYIHDHQRYRFAQLSAGGAILDESICFWEVGIHYSRPRYLNCILRDVGSR